MKSRLPLLAGLSAFVVCGALFACSEKPPVGGANPSDGKGFTLAQIKRSFAAHYAAVPPTRSDDRIDEDDILSPGRITPIWDSVSLYFGGELFQARIPFDAPYGYRLLRRDENGDPLLAPLPNCLVVLKDPLTDETASYLRFFIPSTEPDASTAAAGFTGLVLHTTLSGLPVSVGQYDGGALFEWASLFDDAWSWEENIDRIFGLLQNICFARVRENIATRGVNDDNPIPEVVIVGYWKPIEDVENPDAPPLKPGPPFDIGDGTAGSGGGGGGVGPNPTDCRTYPKNPRISASEPVQVVLDSIFLDCMGQLLINAMPHYVDIRSGYFGGSKTNPIPTGYSVKIGSRCDPLSVSEELIHIYQGVGTVAYHQGALNNEVEAKLGWYMYWKRNGSKGKIDGALGGHENQQYFEKMRECFLQNDLINPEFTDAFEKAARGLRSVGAYANIERYPFDPEKTKCDKLLELMKDCIGK